MMKIFTRRNITEIVYSISRGIAKFDRETNLDSPSSVWWHSAHARSVDWLWKAIDDKHLVAAVGIHFSLCTIDSGVTFPIKLARIERIEKIGKSKTENTENNFSLFLNHLKKKRKVKISPRFCFDAGVGSYLHFINPASFHFSPTLQDFVCLNSSTIV